MTNRQNFATWTSVLVILAIGLPLIAGPYLFSGSEQEEGTHIKTMPVNVMRAELVQSFELHRKYTGIIRAQQSSELGFELGGKIEHVLVEEGEIVARDEVLATLDTESLNARKKTVSASLAQASSVYDELLAGPRRETRLAAQADVDAAEAIYENAKFNSNRRESLLESRSISKEEYDQAKVGERTAAARFSAAQHRLAELTAGTRIEKLAASESAVEQLEAAIEEIEISIRKSQIKAPFAGTITKRFLDPGSILLPSTPVLTLQQHTELEAWVGLPLDAAAHLKTAQKTSIWVGGKKHEVVVKAKLLKIEPSTRTQTVILKLASESAATVVAGQICKLDVSIRIDESGIWLPTTALTQGIRGLWSVMVAEEKNGQIVVVKRDVQVIHTDVDLSLVRGTLLDGNQVIVDGVHRVVVGQEVQIQMQSARHSTQPDREQR